MRRECDHANSRTVETSFPTRGLLVETSFPTRGLLAEVAGRYNAHMGETAEVPKSQRASFVYTSGTESASAARREKISPSNGGGHAVNKH